MSNVRLNSCVEYLHVSSDCWLHSWDLCICLDLSPKLWAIACFFLGIIWKASHQEISMPNINIHLYGKSATMIVSHSLQFPSSILVYVSRDIITGVVSDLFISRIMIT